MRKVNITPNIAFVLEMLIDEKLSPHVWKSTIALSVV